MRPMSSASRAASRPTRPGAGGDRSAACALLPPARPPRPPRRRRPRGWRPWPRSIPRAPGVAILVTLGLTAAGGGARGAALAIATAAPLAGDRWRSTPGEPDDLGYGDLALDVQTYGEDVCCLPAIWG